CVQAIASPFTF
nr:immunoglobulin light chain junction region [Macaca mulatta]